MRDLHSLEVRGVECVQGRMEMRGSCGASRRRRPTFGGVPLSCCASRSAPLLCAIFPCRDRFCVLDPSLGHRHLDDHCCDFWVLEMGMLFEILQEERG